MKVEFKKQMYKIIILLLLFFTTIKMFGQWTQEKKETDSTKISIIRNSVYWVYEETYKNKDSVFMCVRLINDTTIIVKKGWQRKDGTYLGIWVEYTEKGELKYIWNHEKNICIINPRLYPNHKIMEWMKVRADNLIIKTYGRKFYENYVKFDFKCKALVRNKILKPDGLMTVDNVVGTWFNSLQEVPNIFLFNYDVVYEKNKVFKNGISFKIDLLGNFIENDDNNKKDKIFGFEKLEIDTPYFFKIDREEFIEKSKNVGRFIIDTTEYDCYLTWESNKSNNFYNGNFRYYILVKNEEIRYINENKNEDSKITKKFTAYVFNPWTGNYLYTKKFKSRYVWENSGGYYSGLKPIEE